MRPLKAEVRAQTYDKAVAGIANHPARFWAPAMRKKFVHHLSEGGEGLDPLVRKPCKEWCPKRRATPDNPVFQGDSDLQGHSRISTLWPS